MWEFHQNKTMTTAELMKEKVVEEEEEEERKMKMRVYNPQL